VISYNYQVSNFPVTKVKLYHGHEEFVIDSLCPLDDKSFETNFIRKDKRHKNANLDFFVSHQIEKFFTGSESYICVAQVVKAYKSIEIRNLELIEFADKSIDDAYALLDACKFDWHPRKNKEHLLFSMLCAQWHLKIAKGDKDGFLNVIERILASLNNISNFLTPSFPINLSLLIYVLYLKAIGQDTEAKKYSTIGLNVFKKAVNDSDYGRVTLFGELAVSHSAVLHMLQIDKEKFQFDEQFKIRVISSFRVKGKASQFLLENFKEMIN
ncbi:hypothetical protein P0F03_003379, partial [Vibrio metschnikovii]|nr:hypothetical protein [Vibrio metschnikovii]